MLDQGGYGFACLSLETPQGQRSPTALGTSLRAAPHSGEEAFPNVHPESLKVQCMTEGPMYDHCPLLPHLALVRCVWIYLPCNCSQVAPAVIRSHLTLLFTWLPTAQKGGLPTADHKDE